MIKNQQKITIVKRNSRCVRVIVFWSFFLSLEQTSITKIVFRFTNYNNILQLLRLLQKKIVLSPTLSQFYGALCRTAHITVQ